MVTIEDIIDNTDKEDLEKHLLGYLRLDLARVGFFETYVKPYNLSVEEGHEKLEKVAEAILDHFNNNVYDTIKHQTRDEVKNTELPKAKKEYDTVRNATTKAFKKFKQEHIAKTLMMYHFYRKILKL